MEQPGLPPPGFYDAGEDSGRERWWDGATWTDHYRSAPSAPPSVTPPPAVAVEPPAVTAEPPATVESPRLTCPHCGGADSLARIGAIIEQGTSTTTGQHTTRTRSFGTASGSLFIDGSVGYSTGTTAGTSYGITKINETTRTQLATQLMWPPAPRFDIKRWFLRWYVGLSLIIGTLILPLLHDDKSVGVRLVATYLTCLAFMWIPALVIAAVQRSVTAPARAKATAIWNERGGRLLRAHYCLRDGVVVEDGRTYSAGDFKAMVYGS